MNFRGSVYYPQNAVFSRLVLPFAQVQKLFYQVYHFILQTVWQELISGKTIESELANLVLFVIFCVFSLLIFYFQEFRHLILLTFFLLWVIDRTIAQRYYNNARKKFPVSLQITPEKVYFKNYRPQQQAIELEFNREEIKESAIAPRTLYSDGFQSEIKVVWQVFLYLPDNTEILISEENKPEKALAKAKSLASSLEIPIAVLNSEGNHDYAIAPLAATETRNENSVKVKLHQQKWQIYSQWRLQDSWQLIKEMLQQSGFLLFVIVAGNFMIVFGGFVDAFISGTLQPGFVAGGDWNQLKLDWESYLELFIAISSLIVQGVKISQTKDISLDYSSLKYRVNRQQEGELKPQQIEAVLFICEPDPMLLILGEKEGIAIEDLPNPDAYRVMLQKIEIALKTMNIIGH